MAESRTRCVTAQGGGRGAERPPAPLHVCTPAERCLTPVLPRGPVGLVLAAGGRPAAHGMELSVTCGAQTPQLWLLPAQHTAAPRRTGVGLGLLLQRFVLWRMSQGCEGLQDSARFYTKSAVDLSGAWGTLLPPP